MPVPTQAELIANLPSHLRAYARVQDYSRYTAREHAAWRFALQRLAAQLQDSAHPVYREGLRQTGISLECVPDIETMNTALDAYGWSAVVVDGFIPPAIFMEFQARRILVIAQDMRAPEHILYTPAPDIVHESAGHAPFIVDTDYAEYLQRFGEVGMKAIASAQDQTVYEAIRRLSIVKQDAASTPEQISAAEATLQMSVAANRTPSEATRLARLHWWTVEYGLVGEPDNYHLFGAGLLSSLGESRHSLDDTRVPKYPLTVDAVDVAYDITTEQPQLFVTRSCKHMSQVLEEFAASMCAARGGANSLQTAIDSATVCTAQYSSGLQVSGHFVEMHTDAVGHLTYIRTGGPTQLAYEDCQLSGHDGGVHAQGFGSPVGMLKELPQCLSTYSVDELKSAGIVLHQACSLDFLSGIRVQGVLEQLLRKDHRNLILSFTNCRVTDRHGTVLFNPSWGRYDMAVGARISSVYGGMADRRHDPQFAAQVPAISTASSVDVRLMDAYQQIRDARSDSSDHTALIAALSPVLTDYSDEWLLRAELLELIAHDDLPLAAALRKQLDDIAKRKPTLAELITLI